MNDCTHCIMEHTDGLVLAQPTIYVIEGDFYQIDKQTLNRSQKEETLSEDEMPF